MLFRLKSLLIFQACTGVVANIWPHFLEQFLSNDEEFFNCPSWPNALILGAQKAATTTLYKALVEHPDVCESKLFDDEPKYRQKEIHFFDDEYDNKSPEWYCSKFSECAGNKVSIEATPNYLNFDIARRMKETFPLSAREDLKMVAILRNPVDRMLSWYNHIRGIAAMQGEEDCHKTPWCEQFLRKSFEGITPNNTGVRSANTTIAQGDHLDQFISFDEFYSTDTYSVDIGKYADILEEYFEVFDHENILVLNFDYFMEDPKRSLVLISYFLEIGDKWDSDFKFTHANDKRYNGKKDKYEIDCKYIEELDDFYAPYNTKLHYMLYENRDKFWHYQPYFKHFERLPRCSDSPVFYF